VQIPLGRGDVRVAHRILHRDEVGRVGGDEAAEGMAQIMQTKRVNAADASARL
jgi:hypothetical protein